MAAVVVSDESIARIPGWFQDYDRDLFRFLLPLSAERVGGGDLAELGVYLGKSAALIGDYVAPDEVFTVIDLFGAEAPGSANGDENADQYPNLSQEAFQAEYLRVHDRLPVVVKAPSADIIRHARTGRHRFVHVDGSHLYEHVAADIRAARELLKPDGVVVFDDYRSEHTPGVSAAVWGAVERGLTPFALSPVKMYATFGDPEPWSEAVASWATSSRWASEVQQIVGHPVVRLWWGAETERTAAIASEPSRSVATRVVERVRRALT